MKNTDIDKSVFYIEVKDKNSNVVFREPKNETVSFSDAIQMAKSIGIWQTLEISIKDTSGIVYQTFKN